MSMCESILTIALVCTVKYLHYCDYYYTLGNDSQSTPKLIAYASKTSFRSLWKQNWMLLLVMKKTGKKMSRHLIREMGIPLKR